VGGHHARPFIGDDRRTLGFDRLQGRCPVRRAGVTMRAPTQCVVMIRPLDANTPSAWLSIGGRPFLDYLLLEAWRFGFSKVLFIADGGGSRVRASLDASRIGEETRLSIEVVDAQGTGTGGALHAARGRLDDRFLLLDGHCWFDFNWLSLVTVEGAEDAVATLALRKVGDGARHLLLDGSVVRMAGDPSDPGIAFGKVALLTSRIVEYLLPSCSLESDALVRLAQLGLVRGLVASGRFIDIADPADRAIAGAVVPKLRQRPAVFLDRDGTLNEDTGYVHRAADFRWFPGAMNAVRRLNDGGYYVFVVTNQSGVARGMFDEAAVQALHRWMNGELRAAGAHIDDIRYCPHHPDGSVAAYRAACACRKPAAGMLLDLMNCWPIVEDASVMIGDKDIDAAAGQAAEIASAIVPPGALESYVETLLRRR
jgi:D,D-heptose 1,7-bisphosphate phosphatase